MPPRFRDLKKYCDNNGWDLIRTTNHYYYYYIKVLSDGTVLRTRVSFSLASEIPGNLWQKIVKHQLKTTEEQFWKDL